MDFQKPLGLVNLPEGREHNFCNKQPCGVAIPHGGVNEVEDGRY